MTLSVEDRKYFADIGIRVDGEDAPQEPMDDREAGTLARFVAGTVIWAILGVLAGGTVWAMLAVFAWGGNWMPR